MSLNKLILVTVLAGPAASLAAAEWRSASSGAVEVRTDAGPGMAARILAEALNFYAACARVRELDESLPYLKIVYFARESDYRRLRGDDGSKGFYHRSGTGSWILVHGGADAVRRLRHELVHVMNDRAGFAMAPAWLNEGLAEYYSTLDVPAASRGRVLVASIENLAQQASGSTFTEDDLSSARTAIDQGLFYARAWALVRQMAADGGDGGLNRFAGLLRDGIPKAQAFLTVYGAPAGEMIAKARLNARRAASGGVWAGRSWPESSGAVAHPVSSAEIERMFEEIRRSMGRPTLAHQRREHALRDAGLGPDNHSRPAMAQLRRGNLLAALDLMRHAAAQGTRDAVMWFEYAMLLRETGSAKPDWLAALRRAVELDPGRTEGWFVLGVSTEGDESINALHRAANTTAATSWMWEAYGRALLRADRKQEARSAAQEALIRATGIAEKSMAEGLLASLDTLHPEPAEPRPPAITAGSWARRPARAAVEGLLIEVDCSASTPVLVIETSEGLLRTAVRRSGIRTDGAMDFTCGPQPAKREVLIGHDAKPDQTLRTSGDLVSIEHK